MTCHKCGSTDVELVERHQDSSLTGVVTAYVCLDCGEITHDVPPEKVDAERDRKMTESDDVFENDNA